MKKNICVDKNNLDTFFYNLFLAIDEKLKLEPNFFDRNDILLCNKNKYINISNLEDLKIHLKNKFCIEAEKIKNKTFDGILNISLLESCNSVKYLRVEFSLTSNTFEYTTLLNEEIFSINKKNIYSKLLNYADLYNFNLEQKEFLKEFLEESIPSHICLDNFIYIFEEAVNNCLNLPLLGDLLEPTIESAYFEDYSKEIFKILITEDTTLNLFHDKLSIKKFNNGYEIFFNNTLIKKIEYKLSFI